MVPFSAALVELLMEPGVSAMKSGATREAVPIFLERGAMLALAAGGWKHGRGAVALRGVVHGESRQVYFRGGLGFLEGTPLCPSKLYW